MTPTQIVDCLRMRLLTVWVGQWFICWDRCHWRSSHFSVNNSGQSVWYWLTDTVAMSHTTSPLALINTTVRVCFSSVSVLKTILPRTLKYIGICRSGNIIIWRHYNVSLTSQRLFTFIFSSGSGTTSDTITALESTCPFTFVCPPAFGFNTKTTSLSLS